MTIQRHSNSLSSFGRHTADYSLDRGIAYGTIGTPVGSGIGALLGIVGFYIVDLFVPMEGEILLAPIVVGSVVGALVGGTWSIIYFSKSDFSTIAPAPFFSSS